MKILVRKSLKCVETTWLAPLRSKEAPPVPVGFKRESIRIHHPAEGGIPMDGIAITTLDVEMVTPGDPIDSGQPIAAMVESWDRSPGSKVHWHLFEELGEAQEFERGAVEAGERRYLHLVGCGWSFHPKRQA